MVYFGLSVSYFDVFNFLSAPFSLVNDNLLKHSLLLKSRSGFFFPQTIIKFVFGYFSLLLFTITFSQLLLFATDMKRTLLPYFSLEVPTEIFGHAEVGGVIPVWIHLISLSGEGFAAVLRRPALLHDPPRFVFFLRWNTKQKLLHQEQLCSPQHQRAFMTNSLWLSESILSPSCQSGSWWWPGSMLWSCPAQTGILGDALSYKTPKRGFKTCRGGKKTSTNVKCCFCWPSVDVVRFLRERADDDLRPVAFWVIARHQLLEDHLVLVVVAAESLHEAAQTDLHGDSQCGILQTDARAWEQTHTVSSNMHNVTGFIASLQMYEQKLTTD